MKKRGFDRGREKAIIDMYNKGGASAVEFLKSSYSGDWPPLGLDIVNPPNMQVKFKSAYRDVGFLIRSFVMLDPIEAFWLFNSFKKGPIRGAIVYGLITLGKALSIGGFVRPIDKPGVIHVNDVYALARNTEKGELFFANIQDHEFCHTLQGLNDQVSLTSPLKNDRHGIMDMFDPKKLNIFNKKRYKYLGDEAEVQARLWTVLSNSYQQHGVAPVTQMEFLASLHSQGVQLGDDILGRMRQRPAGRAALSRFPVDEEFVAKHSDRSAAKELSSVIEKMSAGKKEVFVLNVLPMVYGDWLEIIGDRFGSKRMGHDHNVLLREIFLKNAKEAATASRKKDALNLDIHVGEISRIAKIMPADDACNMFTMIARGHSVSDHHETLSITFPRRTEVWQYCLQRLYENPDLTASQRTAMKAEFNAATLVKPRSRSKFSRPFVGIGSRLGF